MTDLNYYILRYGEIALKGKNRKSFEQKLVNNIRSYILNKYNAESKINRIRGRLVLEVSNEVDLRPIFGLTSYSSAIKISNNIEDIKSSAIKLFNNYKNVKSFKVQTYRLDKSYELISPEVSKIVGSVIYEKFKVDVDLKKPELIFGIEIHKDYAYLFTDSVKCFSGLPLGSSDTIHLFFENDNRSILSALELMKRGCKVILITQDENININKIKLLELYNNYYKLQFVKNIDKEEFAYASPVYINKIHKEQDFTLYPIALLSDKEVDEELKKYDIFKT